MLMWIILGGLACVGLGVVIGYRYCSWINGKIFQALIDTGKMVIKTEDGWQGEPSAFDSLILEHYLDGNISPRNK